MDFVEGPNRGRINFKFEDFIRSNRYDGTKYWKVKLQDTGTFALVKIKNKRTEKDYELHLKEIALGQKLLHPNIVEYRGQRQDIINGDLMLMTEDVSRGSIYDLLRDEPTSFDNYRFFEFAAGATNAVHYLHTRDDPVVHGDIRSMNFYVTNTNVLKLGNFQYAKVTRNLTTVDEEQIVEEENRIRWQAPEVIRDAEVSVKSDVWSLHVFFAELITKEPPFKHVTQQVRYNMVKRIFDEDETPYNMTSAHPSVQNFFKYGWKIRPWERPSIDKVLEDLHQLHDHGKI